MSMSISDEVAAERVQNWRWTDAAQRGQYFGLSV